MQEIMQYRQSMLIAPDGSILWTVDYKDKLAALKDTSAEFGGSYDTLLKMCGSPTRANGNAWVNPTDLKKNGKIKFRYP